MISAAVRRFAPIALLAAAVAFSSTPPVAAQQSSGPALRADVNLVLVEATVKDKSGHVVDGLAKDDFVVSEDGATQALAHFSRDQLPLAVVLVVDLSTSITPFLRPLRYATMTALRSLKAEDQVALFTFSSEVERRVDLTRDKHEIADQIESFSSGGSTNINAALYQAASYLEEQAPAARRVIILVSDNVPTDEGGVAPQRVLDKILEADAALYDLKIPGRNPLAARMRAKMGDLVNVSKVAGETGGEIFDVEKEGSLYLAFEALIQRLKTRYTLGYYPTNSARDGRFRKLQVSLQPRWGSAGKDYTILAKRGYFAPRVRAASLP